MRIFISLLYLSICSSTGFAEESPVFPKTCQENCISPFGEKLGTTADHVPSYSNCQAKCVYEKPNLVEKNFAGIEWQCVEFARRWLMINEKLTFESIDVAADLWNKIDHLVRLNTKEFVPLKNHLNGSPKLPKPGDLVIYGREYLDTGHVAIVLRVEPQKHLVFVGEQNFLNKRWPGNYARAIPYVSSNGKYWILDNYLIGWKSYH